MKEDNYYRQQIRGLILILESNAAKGGVSRGYVKEKLNMILSGGIGFHPNIARRVGIKNDETDNSEMEGVE